MSLIVASALALRLFCFVGLMGSDDLGYIEQAHALATGRYEWSAHAFARRFGVIVPMALSERLFGPWEASYVLPFLAASVATILIAGWIGRRAGGTSGGWLAAGVIALLPLNVYGATDIHSDLPMAAWALGALALLFRQGLLDRPGGEPRPGDARVAAVAGLCIGAAYLTKSTGCLAVPAVLILAPGRRRLFRVLPWLGGGAGLVVGMELLMDLLMTGNAFYHAETLTRGYHIRAIEEIYPTTSAILQRALLDRPRMLLDPRSGSFPMVGGVFGVLAILAALRIPRCRETFAGLGVLGLWAGAWLLMLNFWPVRLWPYLPAQVLAVRVLEVGVTPAAIVLGVAAARSLADPRRWMRGATAGLLALMAAGQLTYLVVIRDHTRSWSRTAREALAGLGDHPGVPILTDDRSAGMLKVLSGYRDAERYRPFPQAGLAGTSGVYVVVNRYHLHRLESWYGTRPPDWVLSPPSSWRVVREWTPPPQRSLRGLLWGGGETGVGGERDKVTVYWIPE
jgi:hypothetical protein